MALSRLTYSDGLTRLSQALAHVGALREVLPLYTRAVARDPGRYARGPTPAQLANALMDVMHAIQTMNIDDFREDA